MNLLLVANANSPESLALAADYQSARQVPDTHLLLLDWKAEEKADTCTLTEFKTRLEKPILDRAKELSVDILLLCRNLPIKIAATRPNSVDSTLASIGRGSRLNPYYSGRIAFSAAQFGMYLVCRLDGWSWKDAHLLIKSSLAAQASGAFLFDCDPAQGAQYQYLNKQMQSAEAVLRLSGVSTLLNNTATFDCPDVALGGYYSWGSNDKHFSKAAYAGLRFVPGAIGETAVSTSGRLLRFPGVGQSQVAQLVQQGITGVVGYVSEPDISAISHPTFLMQRYTQGRTLAEAFYAAGRLIGWKSVILGDPLCCPYAKGV